MRYRDLVQESMFGSQQGPQDMIQTVIMSLSARGITDIPTRMVAQELRKQFRMNVPYGQLVDILASLPMVGSANNDNVSLRDENEAEMMNGEDAKSKVADMASNGVKADKTF